MRYYGTITRWNDNRQFGAIREESMGTEVFAPLSAFTTLTRPPAEGQRVSFDIVKGRRGRDEAENICFSLDCVDEFDFFDTKPEPYKKNLFQALADYPHHRPACRRRMVWLGLLAEIPATGASGSGRTAEDDGGRSCS